ncbi:DNA-directed RNA polymerase III subunit RPC8 [Cylas formicarius]|uniref:DNA-directed RNA polymerase III subunit RPC8 n=1 Tax=Cylas formicarius TaxID=197179 RepID=UPI002958DBFF|nr:DNA-directed RNA polymerase III subunit RPC8 [Cylas formicarius]
MKNVTRIPPDGELNKKLANKVVLNVGLCIALFDITSLKESFIIPSDGASHTVVHFRYIVFRPFMEEILVGKIRTCSEEGVHVTLGFFDDILIPPNALQHPAKFNETEQAWVWEYDMGDGNKHDLFMDAGENIRFRVTAETFMETCPTGPSTAQDSQENLDGKVPYKLIGSINEPGRLGIE